jgi:hypothetical protein
LDQVSPESGSGGFGLDGGPEDAQAAESRIDERVRTRTPSFFFMTTPPRIEPGLSVVRRGVHRRERLD